MTIHPRQAALRACAIFLVGGVLTLPVSPTRSEHGKDSTVEYQEDLKPWVGVRRAGKVALGHLDAQGNFIPQPRMEPIDPANPFSGPNYAVINEPARKDEPVYEYRSGSLIQGTLDKEGDFRPEVGSKVISFQDYLKGYNPQTSLRVYNLPGRLVAKAKKEADKE